MLCLVVCYALLPFLARAQGVWAWLRLRSTIILWPGLAWAGSVAVNKFCIWKARWNWYLIKAAILWCTCLCERETERAGEREGKREMEIESVSCCINQMPPHHAPCQLHANDMHDKRVDSLFTPLSVSPLSPSRLHLRFMTTDESATESESESAIGSIKKCHNESMQALIRISR